MAGDDVQIDKRVEALIERGLQRYGNGDLEGAMSEWRHALSLDPDNGRAGDYVAYIERHYELQGEGAGDFPLAAPPSVEHDVPFGVEADGGEPSDDVLDAYESIEIVAEPGAGAGDDTDASIALPEHADDEAGFDAHLESNTSEFLGSRRASASPVDDGWSVDEGWALDRPASEQTPSSPFDASDRDGPASFVDLDDQDTLSGVPGSRSSEASDAEMSFAGLMDDDDLEGELVTNRGAARANSPDLGSLDLDDLQVAPASSSGEPTSERATGSPSGEPLDLDEQTVPGGEEPLPYEQRSLSSEALTALGSPSALGDDTIDRESTAERSGATEEFAIDDLGALDAGGRRDDRHVTVEDDPRLRRSASVALDDEETLDRSALSWSRGDTLAEPRRRPPTEDPGLDASSVQVDEQLLSFEDATSELNIRDLSARQAEERPTTQLSDRHKRETADVFAPPSTSDSSDDDTAFERALARVAAEVDAALPQSPGDEERLRQRIIHLVDCAEAASNEERHTEAVAAAELAYGEEPDSAITQKSLMDRQETIRLVYRRFLGARDRLVQLAVPMSQLPLDKLDHRAAFLLSRIDGSLTLEDVVDVSGMSEIEASRHLSRLLLRGILQLR